MYRRTATSPGFTLVELAIVLVIIGLLVGAVLVGRDLIRTSSIRATTATIDKMSVAGGTFRAKYRALPGDMQASAAAISGFTTRTGADGRGDGDSMIENNGTSAARNGLGGETALYWRDLADARMISQNFTTATDAVVDSSGFTPPATATLPVYIPTLPIRQSTFLHIYGSTGVNYYQVGGFTSGAATGAITWADGLTPYEAQGIDKKMDDMVPTRGTVRAVTNIETLDTVGTGGATECIDTGQTPVSYNVNGDANGNALICQLRIRAAF